MFNINRHSDGTFGIYHERDPYRPIAELTDDEIAKLAEDLCAQLPLRLVREAQACLDARISLHESFNRIADLGRKEQ